MKKTFLFGKRNAIDSTANTSTPLRAYDVDAEIIRWSQEELKAWSQFRLPASELEARLLTIAESHYGICLFTIRRDQVDFDARIVKAYPEYADANHPIGLRALAYRQLISEALASSAKKISGFLAFALDDLFPEGLDAPIFCFQKLMNSRGILLPDIDLVNSGFFSGDCFEDHLPWANKLNEAIFVGSTTGSLPLTAAHVTQLTNPRLRAAVRFRNVPGITFHLPNVVQCVSPAVARMIDALKVTGRRWDWQEQLSYKYLISIDGNGAACSRVALAMKSNSVLVKYISPYQLYFFHGLKPWIHYIPIASNEDLVVFMKDASILDDIAEEIATESQQFWNTFMSKKSILTYTANVITAYCELFQTNK